MSAAHGRWLIEKDTAFLESLGYSSHSSTADLMRQEAAERREFLAECDTNAKDATRLDWLTTRCEVEVRSPQLAGGAELLWRDGLRPRTTHGNTLREAIDAAINTSHHPNQGDAG